VGEIKMMGNGHRFSAAGNLPAEKRQPKVTP